MACLPAKLESYLDGRNLAGLSELGVGELLMVQTDGSKQDAKRVRVLDKHCNRALYMRLDVPVKKELENSGSSEQPPKPKHNAAASSIMTGTEQTYAKCLASADAV